ncbi:hypothetical protein ISN45_At04g040430 [Arabidopsis thaliana x Arabidopsis arenosa]|uniref:Uncharacterized protein n=2 Tax=Arabidopsis TaxID=3701 RepID=A0A8T2EIW2_ARASU|nr:hypothetical protein ISN45_At04g040430 [Arabidopsis thaliana x Arabidopsis arenosa]KAG7623296.1 hypothetical protein ISN44_As04g040070 [Arabidopsis suecica]
MGRKETKGLRGPYLGNMVVKHPPSSSKYIIKQLILNT